VNRYRLVLLACVATCLLVACGSTHHEALADPHHSGALLGAYVSPSQATDSGRITALENYERALGRQLDVIQTYHKWEAPFPTTFDRYVSDRGDVLLLSWAGTRPSEIVDGRYDSMIRERAQALKKLGSPILLRWRWEMNRPNIQEEIGSPEAYVDAWKHVRGIFQDVGTDNVDWVWCPLANGFEETEGKDYYPGNDQVEWLCADAYSRYPAEPLEGVVAPFLDWAAKQAPDLPVIIGEFGTRQGRSGERARWLDDAMGYFRGTEQVKAVVYYESANAPAGRYDISEEPSALAAMRKWGQTSWLNPHWSLTN
jgi:hypothetical protein